MLLGELTQKIGFSVDAHQLEHLHERLEGISRSVKILAGVEIVHAFFELAERFADMGEHLEATALAAGLSTTELQKLQYAASQNAVKGDELSGALARLNRQLYAAKNGGKQANAIFQKLGIGPEQLATFKNSSEAMAAIQDAMVGITDANERQAITMQLFGRGSSNMIKFLTVGSARTKELGESAEAMGAVVSEDGVKALAEFEDAMSGLGQVIKSFLATVGAQLAPAFVEVIHMIEQSWARSLPLIQKNLRAFVLKAAFYIGAVAEAFRLLIKLVVWFAEDHAGILLFVAKWGPAVMVAVSAFELFVDAIGKANGGWLAAKKYAPPAWRAMLWGIEKLQYLAFVLLTKLADGLMVFTPGLAARIRLVALSLAGLTPLQFTLVVAGIAALVVAVHDLYEYFFKDVPFEKLWIGRLLKRAEPIIGRLKWLLKPFKEIFMLGDLDADDPSRGVSLEATEASYKRGPMSSAAASLPSLFGGANQMGQKFRPDDPVNAAPVKTSVMLNMPVSVTIPPGTSTPESVRMLREGVSDYLLEQLNQAHADLQPAAAR